VRATGFPLSATLKDFATSSWPAILVTSGRGRRGKSYCVGRRFIFSQKQFRLWSISAVYVGLCARFWVVIRGVPFVKLPWFCRGASCGRTTGIRPNPADVRLVVNGTSNQKITVWSRIFRSSLNKKMEPLEPIPRKLPDPCGRAGNFCAWPDLIGYLDCRKAFVEYFESCGARENCNRRSAVMRFDFQLTPEGWRIRK